MTCLYVFLIAGAIVVGVYAVIALGAMFIDWLVPDDEVYR